MTTKRQKSDHRESKHDHNNHTWHSCRWQCVAVLCFFQRGGLASLQVVVGPLLCVPRGPLCHDPPIYIIMCSECENKKAPITVTTESQRTLSQAPSGQRLLCCTEAQLPTHHVGRQQAPVIVTYGAPLSVFQHLHPALAYNGPTAKTNQRLLKKEKRETVEAEFSKTTYLGSSGSLSQLKVWTSTFPSPR